jgi:hypothetical protein
MKRPLSVIVFLLAGLVAGCAPAASGGSQAVTGDTGSLGQERATAQPVETVELEATAAPTSTAAPASTPTPACSIPIARRVCDADGHAPSDVSGCPDFPAANRTTR